MTSLLPKLWLHFRFFLVVKTAASQSSWRKRKFASVSGCSILELHLDIRSGKESSKIMSLCGCMLLYPDIHFYCPVLSHTLTLVPLTTGVEDIVAIMIPEPKGKEIVSLLERNITVTMYITIGTRNLQKYVSRTSVVFVSISFIVLMIISLAWLVFYYIQRFRYANARDRNQVSSKKFF